MWPIHTGPDRQNSRGNRENAQEGHDRNHAALADARSHAPEPTKRQDANDPCMADRSRFSSICSVQRLNAHDAHSGQHQPDAAVRVAVCPATNTQEMPRKRQSGQRFHGLGVEGARQGSNEQKLRRQRTGEYGRPIITSQASITCTLEKQDLQTNLRIKLRSMAKDPIGGNLLITTTATTGLVTTVTLRIPRSHSKIGPCS